MLINNVSEAVFIKRPNRFQGYVNYKGNEIMVHVPNTGRCKEILIPGTKVYLREENNPNRKTKFDLIAAYKQDKLINIDSHIPNKVVEEALKSKMIGKLKKYDNICREKTFGNSRFDFKLIDSSNDKEYFLEVKGVTLEFQGKAMFPDAPTERGTKHLLELIEVIKSGRNAGVLFLIQMDNISSFEANKAMDMKFAEALKEAYYNGVDVFAYDCNVTKTSITINKEIMVII